VATLVLALALPAIAQAQGGRRAGGNGGEPTPSVADLDEITPQLDSSDPEKVREAIDLLSVIDDPRVIPHLAELLRSGQPDPITDRALQALQGLAHPKAIEVLTEFTKHRRTGARKRAYQALAAIDDPRIPDLLEQGLRDPERSVRSTAALSLGEIGAKKSLGVLFQAFEAGVVEAAIAIGKLGDAESVKRFTEHLGERPLGIMLSGYRHFVRRDDISDETKTEIVTELGEVSGPMVRRFLEDYMETFPEDADSELVKHVSKTLRRIPEE
jgi:HEAT repeat protein